MQGPTDMTVWQNQLSLGKWHVNISCPAELATCPISVHNGKVLATEPLQNQVQQKMIKEPLRIKIF